MKNKGSVRLVFETSHKGLARQVAKAIKVLAKRPRRGAKGKRNQYDGWQQDRGPSGPWGQSFQWAQDVKPPWNQSSKKLPSRKGHRVKPGRSKNVRRALRRATARRR
jgi:hypothetical protein